MGRKNDHPTSGDGDILHSCARGEAVVYAVCSSLALPTYHVLVVVRISLVSSSNERGCHLSSHNLIRNIVCRVLYSVLQRCTMYARTL